MSDFVQAWADMLSSPEKGEVVTFRRRSNITHHYPEPAPVLKLADHQ
jgi:hypothetical protein